MQNGGKQLSESLYSEKIIYSPESNAGQLSLPARLLVHKTVQIYVVLHHLRSRTVSISVLVISGLLSKISKLAFIKLYFFAALRGNV